MSYKFPTRFENPNFTDSRREKTEAELELKIQQTTNIGIARGYQRQGKQFEADVILSRVNGNGQRQQPDPFDPLVAVETAKREQLLRAVQQDLASEIPEVAGDRVLLPNMTYNQLLNIQGNKTQFRRFYQDYRNSKPQYPPGNFFFSPQFQMLTGPNTNWGSIPERVAPPAAVPGSSHSVSSKMTSSYRTGRHSDVSSIPNTQILHQYPKPPETPERAAAVRKVYKKHREGLRYAQIPDRQIKKYLSLPKRIRDRLYIAQRQGKSFQPRMLEMPGGQTRINAIKKAMRGKPVPEEEDG